MYEAWIRLQLGDIDVAVAMGSGRSSTADPALIYPMEMDPYYLAPLGTDAASFAALQARALLDAGKVTERQMAEIAARCRRDAKGNPHAQVTGDFDVDELLAERLRALAAAPPRPPADHRRRGRGRDRPRRQGPGAVRQPGLDHRPRPLQRAALPRHARPRRRRRPPRSRARPPGWTRRRSRWPSSRPRSPTRSRCSWRRSASATTWPSTRRAGRWRPTRSWRPASSASPRPPTQIRDHGKHRTLAHSTSGPCLQQNLVCILEGDK